MLFMKMISMSFSSAPATSFIGLVLFLGTFGFIWYSDPSGAAEVYLDFKIALSKVGLMSVYRVY